jgi:hypothetical protein
LALIFCAILGAVIAWRQKRRKQIIKDSIKDNNFELNSGIERYDDILNEYDENHYEKMNYELNKYDSREYAEINYDEMNVEENIVANYTEILE